MSTVRTTTLAKADGSASVPVDTVINGTAKAWVNFNGTGTIAIRAAFNVSSITDGGAGDYMVNFTAALADANYSAVAWCKNPSETQSDYVRVQSSPNSQYTTTQFRFYTANTSGTFVDTPLVNVAVFR